MSQVNIDEIPIVQKLLNDQHAPKQGDAAIEVSISRNSEYRRCCACVREIVSFGRVYAVLSFK